MKLLFKLTCVPAFLLLASFGLAQSAGNLTGTSPFPTQGASGLSQFSPSPRLNGFQGQSMTMPTNLMPRGGGSFGGGGHSFGGGGSFGGGRSFGGGGSFGGGRSFGGGSSFGGGRSFGGGGSFGGGRSSFGGSSSSGGGSFGGKNRTMGSSFGRSGSMGSSGPIYSSSVRPSNYGSRPSYTSTYYVNGSPYTAYGFGFMSGYSLGWLHPSWYYYTPFTPYWYYSPPSYYGGAYYPGGFSFTKFLFGIIIIGFIIWLIAKLIKGKGVRYTTYN